MKSIITLVLLGSVSLSLYSNPFMAQLQTTEQLVSQSPVAIDQITVNDTFANSPGPIETTEYRDDNGVAPECVDELARIEIVELMDSAAPKGIKACGQLLLTLDLISPRDPEELETRRRGVFEGRQMPNVASDPLEPAQPIDTSSLGTECADCP